MPFLNLAAQHASLKDELVPAVEEVLASGHYVLGPNVEAFERELAQYIGTRGPAKGASARPPTTNQMLSGVGVNSGSDALTLALRALDVGPGDEVITSPFMYIAPAEAIHQVGARIVFADIDRATFNIDPREVQRRITPRTKAVIPVHLFGQAAAMRELQELCGAGKDAGGPSVAERRIEIVEDCAQAAGAKYHGQNVGSFGKLTCFSFYPTKNLGADGDGGMILTRDEALARKLRMLRVHGIERRYHHELHGYNSRLDELQAAILRVKLRHLDEWNRRRTAIAARYDAGLKDLPVKTPVVGDGNSHVYHVYAILVDRRDELQKFLSERGVPTIIYYPLPLHLQKVYEELGYREGDFPVAEEVSRRVLPLPMYPELSDAQVDYVIEKIREFAVS